MVVRVDGELAHVPSNSHSGAVKDACWTENDSVHKAKRFVECEWDGSGDYSISKVLKNDSEENLSKKQRDRIDLHYGNLSKALKGDLDAIAYFDSPKFSDVIDRVLWSSTADLSIVTKFLCDAVKLKKEIAELSKAAKKEGQIASEDSAKNASSGHSAKNASSGDYAKNASSGDSAKNASSGRSATNASSGDSATNASSGDSATNEGTGAQSVCAAAGLNSRAKVGANGCFSLTWHDGKRPRIVIGYAGEDGIAANIWYGVDDKGKIVEVK